MYSHTKKVGSPGRYGARLSRKIRENVKTIEDQKRKQSSCQSCGKKTVKRKACGIWTCKSCGAEYTGGAHTPSTKTK
ncbi:MAG TPA: 50S ribosomal protein L37ae [Candidatus Altiarchaeales archaeon]|nr:50S ribosomal protein L37ae [Candidatus Altiarchaeales archaeon]